MLTGKGKTKGKGKVNDNILNCWGWRPCIPKEIIVIWIIITLLLFTVIHWMSKSNPYKNNDTDMNEIITDNTIKDLLNGTLNDSS